jgi:hypothetical protein
MNLQVCPNCQAKLNPKKIKRHFQKFHPEVDLPLTHRLNNFDFTGESVILKRGISRIDMDLLSFNLRFKVLEKADYFEEIEFDYNRLYNEIDDYYDITPEEMEMDDTSFLQIMKYKFDNILKLKDILDQLKTKLPTYDQFYKAQHQTIFVTWSDLTFDKNKIRISANKAFVKAIDLPSKTKSLKNLKVEFFRKNYSNAKYKLVVYRGVIMPELSRGLSEILNLVSEHSSGFSRKKRDLIYSGINCKYQRIV